MQKHPEITRQRVQNFAKALRGCFYPQSCPVRLAVYSAHGRIPYAQAVQEAGVIEEGYRFDLPLRIVRGAPLEETSFFSVDQPHVIIDTVKKIDLSIKPFQILTIKLKK